MRQFVKRHPFVVAIGGLSLGLMLGVGMLLGSLAAFAWQPQTQQSQLPVELPLFASASDTGTSMSMATGAVDDTMEGCFFLDFLSGDLQCLVINNRTTEIAGVFKGNVIKDLGIERSKKPSYLMVTGQANFVGLGGGGATRPAGSIVYVLDQNSGNFAAYGFNWNRTAVSARQAQAGPLALLAKGNARTVNIRE